MSEPLGEDGFFAVQVTDGLDDDRAVLVVGDDQIAIEFGDLAELSRAIGKLNPIEVGCHS